MQACSRAGSCCCNCAMSRMLNTTSLEHNCIPATCARCKPCPGVRMAGFRKFQQTSCITHKVFIAVEVCTPAMPFHTFAQRHYLSLVPSDSSCVIIVCNLMGSGDLFPVSFSVWAEIQFKFWHWMLTYWATTVYPGPLFTSKHDRSTSFMSRNRLTC